MYILNLKKRAAHTCPHAFLFLFFFTLFFVSPDKVYSAPQEPSLSQKTGNVPELSKTVGMTQVGAFAIERNAYALAEKLSKEGAITHIAEGVTAGNKKIYRLFVKRDTKSPEKALPLAKQVQEPQTLLIAQSAASGQRVARTPISRDEMSRFATFRIFSNKRDAEEFARELDEKGFTTIMKEQSTRGQQVTYTVYAEKPMAQPIIPVQPVQQDRDVVTSMTPEERRAAALGEPAAASSESSQPASSQGGTPVEAPVQQAQEDEVCESTAKITSKELFGKEGGYWHPFVGFHGFYNDNIYNTRDDRKDDFIFVMSPGVWLTVPRIQHKLLQVDSSNRSPGGFNVGRLTPESFRRYQTYFFYGADIEMFSKHSSENTVNHRAEGLLQYTMRNGLALELLNKFMFSHDTRGTGVSEELDKYRSNLTNFMAFYDTKKTKLRFDYSHFLVNYDSSRNGFRDRHDNALSGEVHYKIKPKTSLFVQYQFVDISYQDDTLSDSNEHHFYGGIEWAVTAKSRGRMKAGYGLKDFSDSSIGDGNDFIFEAQIDHRFTPKTSVTVAALRKTNETNISTTDYMVTTGIRSEYTQQISRRLQGSAKLAYWNEQYKGNIDYAGETGERHDNIYEGGLRLVYNVREWLNFDLGYLVTTRNSNFSDFNYVNNSILFGFSGQWTLQP